MKVLLLNPSSQGIYYRLGLTLPPLGLAYLASFLRQRGHEVEIIDLNLTKTDLRKFPWQKWDVVGISGDTSRQPKVIELARIAKDSGLIVVAGGPHVTFCDKETLQSGVVDYVVRGEGEEIFAELVEALEQKENPKKVKGISFLEEGKIYRTPAKEPPQVLDELPLPARDLLPMKGYNKTKLNGRPLTTMVTSRGCPYRCAFCSSSHFSGTRWRFRSVEKIVAEVQEIVNNYGFRAIAFMDDNFTFSPKRVLRFTDEIKRQKLDIYWWCFSRADTIIKNEAMVEEMFKAGARMVFLGIESVNQRVLDSYKKGLTADMTRRAVEILKRNGIRVWGSFVLGALNDTKETIRQTVDYACSLDLDIAEFSILTPFPGTKLFEEAKEKHYIVNYDWSHYDGAHAVMALPDLSPRDIAKETIRAYIKFYGRLSRLPLVFDGLKKVLKPI